jgi:hypothetical protein
MQAHLADIGLAMGFQVWIPKADREPVLSEMLADSLLESLPFTQFSNAEPTLKTIEQIDVLWLSKKTIVRAFEVEHTTAVSPASSCWPTCWRCSPTSTPACTSSPRRSVARRSFRSCDARHFRCSSRDRSPNYAATALREGTGAGRRPNLEYLKPEVLDKLEEWPGE